MTMNPLLIAISLAPAIVHSEPSAIRMGSRSGFTLDIRGSYRAYSDELREYRGMLTLSIPLHRLVGGPSKRPVSSPDPGSHLDRVPSATQSPGPFTPPARGFEARNDAAAGVLLAQNAPAAERHEAPPGEPPAKVDAAPARAEPLPQKPESRAMASAPRRPLIRVTPALAKRVVVAALRHHGYKAQEARLLSLSSRAKTSALLPEVRLRALRSTDEQLRLTPVLEDPYRYTQAGGEDLLFEARLTWRLDRIAFADEELAVERIRHQREQAKAKLTERVLKALVAWQEARLKLQDELLSDEDWASASMQELEAALELEILTGGRFTELHAEPSPRPVRGTAR